VTLQGDTFVPVPFRELIDAKTGRFRVRHVDVKSAAYQMLAAYMIRLTHGDLEDPAQVGALARAGARSEAALVNRVRGGDGTQGVRLTATPAVLGGLFVIVLMAASCRSRVNLLLIST
jgi:hypothetical protein